MGQGGGMSIEMWLAEDENVGVQSELQRKVFQELAREPALDAANLSVVVEDRTAILGGTVKTYSERIAAERAACRVRGLGGIRNEIALG